MFWDDFWAAMGYVVAIVIGLAGLIVPMFLVARSVWWLCLYLVTIPFASALFNCLD